MTTAAARRTPGRPRSSEADRAILAASLRLFMELGYDALSVEGVAAAAGVGKTTIYRRYSTKRELVVAALTDLAEGTQLPSESGDTRRDLSVYLREAFRMFRSDGLGFSLLGTLLVKERDDPELIGLFRERIVRPRIETIVGLLRRGVERGEVRPDLELELVPQLLAGAIFAHHVATGDDDDAWLDGAIDALWGGVAARRPARRHGEG